MIRDPAIVHVADARGELIAVEFGQLDFPPQRVFVASGLDGGSERGNHLVPCPQLMVLLSGQVDVSVGDDETRLGPPQRLTEPGESIRLAPGQYVKYVLTDSSSSVLVLAESPFRHERP